MTETEKAIRDFCGHHADWWPSTTQVQEMLALAQPEQETNNNGSPCPEFWDWLPKAYNFEGNGNFTKYNMEVAFLAGKQASQPEQEPVAWEQFYPEFGKPKLAYLREMNMQAPPAAQPLTESMIKAGVDALEAIRQTELIGDNELIKRILEAAYGIKE